MRGRASFIAFSLALVMIGCGRPDAPQGSQASPPAAAPAASAAVLAPGRQTFVIVPDQSKASYLANEEFFGGALSKLGIAAGKAKVVGTTHAIEGRFQVDPEHPGAPLGENTFTVRMNTLTTDQSRRDQYIRTDGPRFNDYPLATFKATSVEGDPTHSPSYRVGDEFVVKLTGEMTIREIPKPATFEVRARLMGDTLAGVATTRLLMSSFGIEPLDFYNTLTVADEFGVEVQFIARPEPQAK